MLSNYLSYCAIFPLTPRQLQKYPLGYNYLWMGTTALMDSVPLIDYINLLAISLWHLSASACFPSLVSLLSLLRFIWGATKCSQSAKTFRKGVVRSEGKNKKKEKEDAVWSLTARSASHSVSLLVYPLLLAVLLFSNRILVFFGLLHFVLFLWMKFGERQTHAVETDEWLGRGRTKKKKNTARGGGEEREMVGDWKGRSNPPWSEREGNSEGLKGREKEECWDGEEEKWLWKGKTAIWWAINVSKNPPCVKCLVTF